MTRLSVGIAAGLVSFNLMAADVPPSISSQPSSQAAHAGFNVTLSVTASVSAPLRFQWRFNGSDLDAKTNSTLALTNLQSTQAGNYTVVVTNNAGAATSQIAPSLVSSLLKTGVVFAPKLTAPR